MLSRRTTRRLTTLVTALAVVAGAACGSDAKPSTSETTMMDHSKTPMDHSVTTLGPTSYPVAVQDCGGRSTTYTAAPKRVVTLDPSVTEMLLVLGLRDRIVGYTELLPKDQQWATTKPDMGRLQQLNDGSDLPSKDAVVAARPDLVASVRSSAFTAPLPTRDGWTQLGVTSYEALGACPPGGTAQNFDLLYEDLRNLGAIFDVQDRAAREIDLLQTRVENLGAQAASLPTVTIAPYTGDTGAPATFAGMEGAIVTAAGGTYAWSDLAAGTAPTWEQFVAKDPDVIWILPGPGTTAAALERALERDPRLAAVTAVRQHAYVEVPQADVTSESPRLVDGLKRMVEGLAALQPK